MKPLHLPLRICCFISMVMAGVVSCYARAAYGVVVPLYGIVIMPHDPAVVLQDFSYTPASLIHVGDTLTFTATLNKYTEAGNLLVEVGDPAVFEIMLLDSGQYGDATAGDGVYTNSWPWPEQSGTGENLPVEVQLAWQDGAPGQQLSAPPLTIIAVED